jgi:16S rRNA C1402 N4-methylase RsmH
MRYDSTHPDNPSARDILNNSSEHELSDFFKKFGEDRFHDRLA